LHARPLYTVTYLAMTLQKLLSGNKKVVKSQMYYFGTS